MSQSYALVSSTVVKAQCIIWSDSLDVNLFPLSLSLGYTQHLSLAAAFILDIYRGPPSRCRLMTQPMIPDLY